MVKCKYSKCLHDTRELNKDKAVKVGSTYYHEDCLRTKEEIKQIVALFQQKVNANPVYSQLQSVINNIVFIKGLGSELLLFGLKYYIENKIPLNYPQGLYYVVQNKAVINAFHKNTVKIMGKIDIKNENNNSFTRVPTKVKGFEDIIRG